MMQGLTDITTPVRTVRSETSCLPSFGCLFICIGSPAMLFSPESEEIDWMPPCVFR